MALTQLGDVIDPRVFQPYMTERTAEVSELFRSGAIQQTDEFDERASEKGSLVELPFFSDLGRGSLDSGFHSDPHTDSDNLTSEKRTAQQMTALKNRRWNGWSTADLVQTVIDEDPLSDVGNLVAEYWAHEIQLTALMSLNGLFKASGPLGSNNADHIVSIGAEDGSTDDEVTVDGENGDGKPLIQAMNRLGDNWDNIVAIGMHSKPFMDLQLANLIDFEPLSEQDLEIPRFMGRQVVVDDSLPFTEGTDSENPHDRYTTYLFGEGALAYGEGSPQFPAETDRQAQENGGEETFISRRHYVVHPNGLSYEDTIGSTTPTQDELETAGDWSLKYEAKNVHISAVEHN